MQRKLENVLVWHYGTGLPCPQVSHYGTGLPAPRSQTSTYIQTATLFFLTTFHFWPDPGGYATGYSVTQVSTSQTNDLHHKTIISPETNDENDSTITNEDLHSTPKGEKPKLPRKTPQEKIKLPTPLPYN